MALAGPLRFVRSFALNAQRKTKITNENRSFNDHARVAIVSRVLRNAAVLPLWENRHTDYMGLGVNFQCNGVRGRIFII